MRRLQPADRRPFPPMQNSLVPLKRWRFDKRLQSHGMGPLVRHAIGTVQVNVGKVCNQACLHCHVEAGPKRTEDMTRAVADRVMMLFAKTAEGTVLDITGGAPELNKNFRSMVTGARALGREVIDRCNLTVIFEPGMEYLPDFLAENRVRVVASLPCYSQDNVDAQRGKGTFNKSIEALRILGALGYGTPGSGLTLDLVYNPGGAFLPPAQAALEAQYRAELGAMGIRFSSLLTLSNLPVNRFAASLQRDGKLEGYMDLLSENFNAATVPGLMCLSQVNIGWEGGLYDCDFNQMLEMPSTRLDSSAAINVMTLDSFDELRSAPIKTASHCFGCTAGAGSSCGGAIQSE